MPVEVKISSYKDRIFQGEADFVSSRINADTRSLLSRIKVKNQYFELISGSLLEVSVKFNQRSSLSVPDTSIMIEGDKSYVYKIDEQNIANKTEVISGLRTNQKVEIISGLEEGDIIVAEGLKKVRPQGKIKPINKLMFITELSIKRPTISWVMSMILIVFGLFVFWKLPVRELPNGIQPPVVQIQVDYKSAAASVVDQEVTQVVEDVIGGAEGIKNIDSKSQNGRSTINVEFDTSIDLDNAANDIRERVARIVDNLPLEAEAPQILKRAAGFTTTMRLALSSSTWDDLELGDYAERYLVDQFSSVKNVGRIRVGGLRELSIRVWIDSIKLAANNLTIQEVELALRGENISLPAGTLEANNIYLTLKLNKSYNDIYSIKQLPIKKNGNKVVLLSDVANVEFGPVSEKTLFKAQTKDQINLKTVGIGIYARSGASTVELSKDIKKKISQVKKT